MIKKLSSKAGMSLLEVMLALLILVMLVLGMGTGLSAGVRVYERAALTTSRTMLASDINSKLTDMLRYAEVKKTDEEYPEYVITNLEYGLLDAYFQINAEGVLEVLFWSEKGAKTRAPKPVISSGAYGNLRMVNSEGAVVPCAYNPDGYFEITYHLVSEGEIYSDGASMGKSEDNKFEAVVRVIND